MVDYTQTILNLVYAFGLADTTKWDSFLWDVGYWGEGSQDATVEVEKLISNSQDVTDLFAKEADKNLANTFSPTFEMAEEQLKDSAGYNYLFKRPSTDAEDRSLPTWSSLSAGSVTWTSLSTGTTTWS